MRDLLTDPAWKPEDLGAPLPDSPHAVSVAIPTWKDVVDYEEGDPRIAAAFRCGYPRFFVHPRVQELFKAAEQRFAQEGECCLVFPYRAAADRCREFVELRGGGAVRVEALGEMFAVVMPQDCYKNGRLYWRYCGDTVSSRRAEDFLSPPVTAPPGWSPSGRSGHPGDLRLSEELQEMLQKALEMTEKSFDELLSAPPSPPEDTASAVIRGRLASLAGVAPRDVFLYPSGMAAVSALHRALRAIHPGRPSVQLDFPYVDVLKVQEEYGGAKFFPLADDASIAEVNALARANAVSGVFCEMPSNPLLRCVRVSRFAPVLEENGVLLFIDDTIAGVTNIDALKFADAVTTSLTKAFSGAGDVLAGAVTLNPRSTHYPTLHHLLLKESPSNSLLWHEDALVLELNSRDFVARSTRTSANAAALAAWLEQHPAVEEVYYPRDGDGFEEVARPGAGRGCLLSFVLKDPAKAPAVYDNLMVSKGPSLGTNFTLCCPYTLLAHYTELEWAAKCGVRADLLRVSVGLEDIEDLKQRFARALAS
jgi:cystathionine gamma-synthase